MIRSEVHTRITYTRNDNDCSSLQEAHNLERNSQSQSEFLVSRFHYSDPSDFSSQISLLEEEKQCAISSEESPPRRKKTRRLGHSTVDFKGAQIDYNSLTIVHACSSSLDFVGLQVWGAAFLLADFVLQNKDKFLGCTAMELGCGTGIVSIILGSFAQTVFATDYDHKILELTQRNVEANTHLWNENPFFESSRRDEHLKVREFDWLKDKWECPVCLFISDSLQPGPTKNLQRSESLNYGWGPSDLKQLGSAKFLFASDVIYDDDLTDAFFFKLAFLMRGTHLNCSKILYLSLEKRYNFSATSLCVTANGHDNFLSWVSGKRYIDLHDSQPEDSIDDGNKSNCRVRFNGRMILVHDSHFLGKFSFNKGDTELWEISTTEKALYFEIL